MTNTKEILNPRVVREVSSALRAQTIENVRATLRENLPTTITGKEIDAAVEEALRSQVDQDPWYASKRLWSAFNAFGSLLMMAASLPEVQELISSVLPSSVAHQVAALLAAIAAVLAARSKQADARPVRQNG